MSIRLVVLNDSSDVETFDRRLLVGPNPLADRLIPVSLEPGFEEEDANLVALNPWCFYGRERRFGVSSATFHGYLLARPDDRLLPQGPADESAAALVAEPLEI